MFVYDVTNYSSFEDLDDWYAYIKKCFREAGSDMPKCALVANKSESIVALCVAVLCVLGWVCCGGCYGGCCGFCGGWMGGLTSGQCTRFVCMYLVVLRDIEIFMTILFLCKVL